MKKSLIGLAVGMIVGAVDCIPMFTQKLPWNAIISAFAMWTVSGYFIAVGNIRLNPVLKGIFVSLLVLSPSAPLIVMDDYNVLLFPILPTTIILGALAGYIIEKSQR